MQRRLKIEKMSKKKAKYLVSKKGVISTIYDSQVESSKRRGHRPPEYSKQDLSEWLMSQVDFHKLHSEWVNSKYLSRLKPSVDRKHDDIHYCMSNIQLMTWGENNDKPHKLRGKKVQQFTKGGELIAEYPSLNEAGRQAKIHPRGISFSCSGERETAGGYVWKYKEGVQND